MVNCKKIVSSLTAVIMAISTLSVTASAYEKHTTASSIRGKSGWSTVQNITGWGYNGSRITTKNADIYHTQYVRGSKIGGIQFLAKGGSEVLNYKSTDTCKYVNYTTETSSTVSLVSFIGTGFHLGSEVTDQHQIWYDGDCWFNEDIYNQL